MIGDRSRLVEPAAVVVEVERVLVRGNERGSRPSRFNIVLILD